MDTYTPNPLSALTRKEPCLTLPHAPCTTHPGNELLAGGPQIFANQLFCRDWNLTEHQHLVLVNDSVQGGPGKLQAMGSSHG